MHEVHLPRGVVAPWSPDDIVANRRRHLERLRNDVTVVFERRRRVLERALHDGAQQQLLALRMAILRPVDAPVHAPGEHPTDSSPGDLLDRLDTVVDDLHRLASGQRPRALDALDGGDVVGALRQLAAISGAETVVHTDEAIRIDDASAELCAFVVSEALANVREHANAARCAVHVERTDVGLRIDVIDDGGGGAMVKPGRGIDGLRRQADALGGTLEILSDGAGTDVRLHLPLPSDAEGSTIIDGHGHRDEVGSDAVRGPAAFLRIAGDGAAIRYRCDDEEPASTAPALDTAPPTVWRDDRGEIVDPHLWRTDHVQVRVLVGGELVAVAVTPGDGRRLAEQCRDHADLLLAGRSWAMATPRLDRLRLEHERITRRAASFDDALRRRLVDRPCDELLAARDCLVDGDRSEEAARHVARATELLREIVRRLRVGDDGADATASVVTRLRSVARLARVTLDVDDRLEDELDDESVAILMERVAEELLLDSAPRAEVVLRIRRRRRTLVMTVLLERLPSPVAMALCEELAHAATATASIEASAHGVRLVVEAPCAS